MPSMCQLRNTKLKAIKIPLNLSHIRSHVLPILSTCLIKFEHLTKITYHRQWKEMSRGLTQLVLFESAEDAEFYMTWLDRKQRHYLQQGVKNSVHSNCSIKNTLIVLYMYGLVENKQQWPIIALPVWIAWGKWLVDVHQSKHMQGRSQLSTLILYCDFSHCVVKEF